jgi:hypothetical protein
MHQDEILQLAADLRINAVTDSQIRESLSAVDDLQKLKRVALDQMEELKPQMAYAGVREELFQETLRLVGITLDLEFLVESIDKISGQ